MTSSPLDGLTMDELIALKRHLAEEAVKAGIALPAASTPGALAGSCDPSSRERAHTRAMDAALVQLLAEPNARLMIFSPPQIGKSTRSARWFPFWWLTMNPRDKILLASYAASLAHTHGGAVREMVRMYGADYGLRLSTTTSSRAAWELTAGGGLRSVGVRGGLSGQPMDLGIIDDPFAGRGDADSPTMRAAVWNWYSAVWSARRSPTARELIVMCMTGDTPVLMADGTEKPLRDVRPGDQVATYENGEISTATVRNWCNQGLDSIYRIRMKSGREVRANARHPFLSVDENGNEVWKRTRSIEPGSVLLATGANGGASPAPSRTATGPQSARECATPTTTESAGPTDTTGRHRRSTENVECVTATGSLPTSTTPWSSSSKDCVPSAANSQMEATPEPTGAESSASITTTTQDRSEDCSATTATSQSGMGSRPRPSAPPLTTYSVTHDEVVEVVPCGVEDVFDVQIDRTENFIANGLVSHNTRWHQDDLAGRLLDRDGRVEEGGEWTVLHMPALALPEDHDRGIFADPLGRVPGGPLSHPKIDDGDTTALVAHWTRQKKRSTPRDWGAMYQGTPTAVESALLDDDQIRDATQPAPSEFRRKAVGVDPAGGGRDSVGVVVAGLDAEGRAWFLDDQTARMKADEWPERVCLTAYEHDATLIIFEKNYGGDMPGQLIAQAWKALQGRDLVSGMCPLVKGVNSRTSKVLRAEPIAQAVRTDRVRFARGADLGQLCTEWTMWEPGSTWSPGALDAGVHVVTELLPNVPRGTVVSNPAKVQRGQAPRGGLAARRRAS